MNYILLLGTSDIIMNSLRHNNVFLPLFVVVVSRAPIPFGLDRSEGYISLEIIQLERVFSECI